MRSFAIAAAVCLIVLTLAAAGAQTAFGTVTGTVRDAAGVPVAGATVSLRAGGAPRRTLTDAAGIFTFQQVRVGGYDLTAAQPGFGPVTLHLTVDAGRTTQVPIVLRAAAARGSV